MAQAEQLLKQMMVKWEYLSADMKANYNMKISSFKQRTQQVKQQSQKILARLDDDVNRAKLNINAHEGTREHYDGEMRQKLLQNTEDIYGMNKKLDDIERTGHETVNIMSNANADLYAQRNVV